MLRHDGSTTQKNAEKWPSSASDSETAVVIEDEAPVPPFKDRIIETSSGDDAPGPPPKDWTGGATEKQAIGPGPVKAAEKEYISGIKLFLVIAAVTAAAFLMLLDMTIVSTAVPRITTEFHSLPDIGWYAAAYNVASASIQPLTGKFYSYFKTKWTFISFVSVFMLGSLICGLATSSHMLIVGRAVAGLGTAGIQNGGLTITAASLPLEKRPMATGIILGVAQMGIVLGPILGGALTQYTTWRWCFYINLPIGALVILTLLLIHIPSHTNTPLNGSVLNTIRTKFDITGFLIFAPAAIQVLLALQWGGNSYPWNSATIIGLLCGSVATFVVFALWERHVGDGAMIPPSLLLRRGVWTSCVVMGCTITVIFCASYYLPVYFQSVREASPFISGVYLLPNLLSSATLMILSGFLLGGVFGHVIPFAVSGLVLLSVGVGLLTTLTPHTSTGKWIGYQILLGTGRGLVTQTPMIAIQTYLKPTQIPVGMAVLIFFQTFSGAVGISVAQTIFTNILRARITQYAPQADVNAVVAAGATGINSATTPADRPGVLRAYSDGVDNVMYLPLAVTLTALFCAWGMGWVDIRKKKKMQPQKKPADRV